MFLWNFLPTLKNTTLKPHLKHIFLCLGEAATQYGRLGVKVWICRGEVLPGEMVKEPEAPKQRPMRKGKGRRRPDARSNRAPKDAAKAAAPAEKGGNE